MDGKSLDFLPVREQALRKLQSMKRKYRLPVFILVHFQPASVAVMLDRKVPDYMPVFGSALYLECLNQVIFLLPFPLKEKLMKSF